jgi:hypothetical protein
MTNLQQVLEDAYNTARREKITCYIFKDKNEKYYYVSEKNIHIEKSSQPCIKVYSYGVYATCENERLSDGDSYRR